VNAECPSKHLPRDGMLTVRDQIKKDEPVKITTLDSIENPIPFQQMLIRHVETKLPIDNQQNRCVFLKR
jgi:hypothetical protein